MNVIVLLATLLVGFADGQAVTGSSPYWLGYNGGVTLYISGSYFSDDTFNYFDVAKGNIVSLVNEGDTIECKVIDYLSNTEKIACSTGPKTNLKAPTKYTIRVISDGVEASGSRTVEYGSWIGPQVSTVQPQWFLPGEFVTFTGNFHTDRYKIKDLSDPLEDDLDSGRVLTKVYLGNVDCGMVNSTTGELYDELTSNSLTCLPSTKNIAPMNATLYVTERGASRNSKWGIFVDSLDRLYQVHTYAGVNSVSPSVGSSLGRTLISIPGVGFNPTPGTTEAFVGGAPCDIVTVEDELITCLTPAQDETSPGSRERGFLWEFWDGSYPDLANEEEWGALSRSDPNYSSEYKLDMKFNINVTTPSAGQLTGFLHAPHDGEYSWALAATDAWTRMYVATDGDPNNLVFVNHWEIFTMSKDTPTYFELRYRGTASTEIKGYLNDFNSRYTYAQSAMAHNEVHRAELRSEVVWETQSLVASGTPVASRLYLGGYLSEPVDITNSDEVRTAVLGLVEQKCEVLGTDPSFFFDAGYEDYDTEPKGDHGSIVDDTEPYCGRHSFQPHVTDPKLYHEGDADLMVNALEYSYLCFALKGNVLDRMRITFRWWDKWNRWRHDDVWFTHTFTSDADTWSYKCHNVLDTITDHWMSDQRNDGATMKVYRVYSPLRASEFDEVYVDEFSFSNEFIDVSQTRPSALSPQGILISEVNVNEVEVDNVTSLEVEYVSSNCIGGFPLLGVTDGDAANPAWMTDLDSSATSYQFTVGGGSAEVTRVATATNPVQGTWALGIQGATVSDIPADVSPPVFKSMIEGALGSTAMAVSGSGTCNRRRWDIEWTEDPGRKELSTVDDSGLTFDGDSITLSVTRHREGKIWHDSIAADFLTTFRSTPSVSVRVNGYWAACLGDCSYAFDDSGVPNLSSVAGSMGGSGEHTLTIMADSFSSTDISDFTVFAGMADCSVTAVTSTMITCTAAYLPAGNHPVSVIMQPVGAALQPDPALSYSVALDVTSVTPPTGGTGGGYPLMLSGSGLPQDLAGWTYGSITVGGQECDIITADATSVNFMAPPGSAGSADVSINLSGQVATLTDGFTYDASLSASLSSVSPSTSSVLGGDELSIIGSDFGDGTDGYVMVGDGLCDGTSWADALITCTLPVNNPGDHAVMVYTGSNGFASGSASVMYAFKVTGSSLTSGSINGGTILIFEGEGFGTDCSLLMVEIGDGMVCDVLECSDTQFTCVTRLVSQNHVVTNMGSHSGFGPGYAWDPKVIDIRVGDSVTWTWSKMDPFSQLLYSVFQTATAADKVYDGTGFNSGPGTSQGSMTVDFNDVGTYFYAGYPVADADPSNTVIMSGQVNVLRASEAAERIVVKLGEVEAEYMPSGANPSVTVAGCPTLLTSPFDGCNSTAPSAPDSDNLYFTSDLCYTPTVTGIAASAVENIPGLQGIQVRTGVTLTITGTGFGTSACQTTVRVGPASCSVTASSDTSVTCDLDDTSNIISLKAFPVHVTVINRGIASISVSNFLSNGQVTVVPVVTSFSPTQGSVAGGTIITISGSGLEAFDSQAIISLGSGTCPLGSVSASDLTCTTVATPDSTVALAVYVSAYNIPAIMDVASTSYTFSAAATPTVASVAISGNTVTITGSNFGTSVGAVTVMLTPITSRHKRTIDEIVLIDSKPQEPTRRRITPTEYEDEEDLGVYEEEAEESRDPRKPRIRRDPVDPWDGPSDFWGTFTNTKAKTFEESIKLGAWRMAGSRFRSSDSTVDHSDEVEAREERSVVRQSTSYTCSVTLVTSTGITCSMPSVLSANNYAASVSVQGVGNAQTSGSATVTVAPTISSISPSDGSTNGGAILTISGSGFTPGDVSVTLDGTDCPLDSETVDTLTCVVPAHAAGSVPVVVTSSSVSATSPTDFTYGTAFTPILTSVSPNTGVNPGDTLTLTGSGFMLSSSSDPTVTVGSADCPIITASDTSVTCTAPDVPGGSQTVVVNEATYGYSNNDISITYELSLTSVTPASGGFGGIEITLDGAGFDSGFGSAVTVCGNACIVSAVTSTSITCMAPPYTGGGSSVPCDVEVSNPDGSSALLASGFTYDQSMTPAVVMVSPKRGGTAGGTTLTISGTFSVTGNQVTIDGSPCIVTAESSTEITCETEPHAGPGTYPVVVDCPGLGLATTDSNGEFFYIDLWSSVYTWGNNPVPTQGQLVVISQGQTVLLDESTEVLKAIIIQGGSLIFDDEAPSELILRAEYILIVDGGSLHIGSEDEPFMNDAVIELHGNVRSIELPLYGAKVLAVRNGTIDMHGRPIPVTWTHLAQTANAGDMSIQLKQPVTWKAGDQIVIATTEHRFSANENEVRTIASISADGLTLTLNEALDYEHISIEQTIGGRVIETRAEVGLLTRNVKFRGNINSDFSDVIEACDESFNVGQFDTQSCYNGRYGEEIGSDMFGATLMLFGKSPDQDLVEGRLSYVEVTEAGQAFNLGRYPIHFHLVGRVNTSYVRGCAIHRTYNRAVTIHAANYLLVEKNVAYNVMGQTIFTEDGVEEHNVIQYNLVVYTRTSSSLLNVDITPASYWVVNPNNIVRHNAAAGGTHFGYWYRIERHPTGPSATNSYCPNNAQMGEFRNNTAHSMGRYGLWVFSMDGQFPKAGTCGGKDLVGEFHDFTVWRCDRGAEVVFGGALQFHDFVALDNEHAGLEMVKVKGGFGMDDGPGVFNSLLVGHSALSSGSCGDEASGIIAPKQDIFSIADTKFVNYDTGTCAALSGCSQCKFRQGGHKVQTKNLTFENSPNKLKFQWEHETIWIDTDGSLSGTAENVIVPSMGILPPGSCQINVTEFSVNSDVPGSVCGGLKFLRFNVKGPSIEPDSLHGKEIIMSNSHGSNRVPYRIKRLTTEGWMGILFTGETYTWEFDSSSQITNISYDAEIRFVEDGDYFYISHEFMQKPDSFGTLGEQQNSTDVMPDPATNFHGDYFWDNDTYTMTYMVSYDEMTGRRKRNAVFDERVVGEKRNINFEVYRCFFVDCITPTPPPVPTGRPDVTFRWSDTETWKEVPVGSGGHPDDTTYGLPVAGDEIIIPQGMWLIVDIATPPLARVYVYGTIEFEDVMDHTFEATIIYIQGGSVIAGFSEDAPFTHDLNIVLRGSLDPTDPDNIDMPMPFGVPNVGWKAIGVFGQLILHGTHEGKTWIKLGATASAGDTTIDLAEPADASWVNKEVIITTTSKDVEETEIRTITAVSGSTLTLDQALTYDHLGETFTLSDGTTTFTMAGEVGIMSRNIRIEGNEYPDLVTDSFGGRIIVSKLNADGVDYVGSAQLHNVELKHMGQEGFTDTDDPRYSLAFVGLDVDDGSNYVKRCSFNMNFNTAIGFFGTDNVTVEENVIYHTVGACIRDDSSDNVYKSNLLSVMLFPGTYNGRFEEQNRDWFGAFSLNKASGTVLEDNVVGGSEQAGYQTYGEMCGDTTLWYNNEVHGAIFGVMIWHKGAAPSTLECRRINNFYAWRIWDTAFYHQHYADSMITGVQAVDSRVGVNQIIYAPPSLSHEYLDKTATTENSVFVGASPFHSCDYQNSVPGTYAFHSKNLWYGGIDGGHSGVVYALFVSGPNMAPKFSFANADSYPALYGATYVSQVTFANYDTRSCGTDVALMTNPNADDAVHPIFTDGLTFVDTPYENYLYMEIPNLGAVNPSDCVDMTCDGHKKIVVTDTDGTLLGDVSATATSFAEYEWDGDPSHGVGDYRIPVALRQNSDGSEIVAADKFPNKGIVRDGSCTIVPEWRAWSCTAIRHRMMIIESMDADTEVRRLSPIALIANPGINGYVDLLNGPMDRGWCFGYTCQERISTFYAIVASTFTYEIAMTSTPPQVIRLHLLHSNPSETVLLRIFFPKTQRYDIYVDDSYVAPTNLDTSSSSYKLLPDDPNNPEAFFPTHSDPVGSNYLQREEKFLHVLLRGGHIVDIKTSPMIVLTTGVVVDPNDFFEENVVANVAAMLGVSSANIIVTNVVREGTKRRRRDGLETVTMTFDIASAPTATLNGESGATSGDVLSFDDLEVGISNIVDNFQSGTSSDFNLIIANLEVKQPQSPPEDPGPHKTKEEGSVVIEGGELYSNTQQEAEAIELNESLDPDVYEVPSGSSIAQGVSSENKALTVFALQPHITVLTSDGSSLESLGHESDPWKIKATLVGGTEGAQLLGTNPVSYVNGWANFTDLSISMPGDDYSFTFEVVYPDTAPSLTTALDETFSVDRKLVSLRTEALPTFVYANTDFSIDFGLIDNDSGMQMDDSVLVNQTLAATLRAKKKKNKGKLVGNTRVTVMDSDIPHFTVDNLRITKPGTNYVLYVQAKVMPAGLNAFMRTKAITVLPAGLVIPENPIIRRISMKGLWGKGKAVKGKETMFANKLYYELSEGIGKAFWADINVRVKSRPFAMLKVMGSAAQVRDAVNGLCNMLKRKRIRIKIGKQKFIMGQLRVNGRRLKKCDGKKRMSLVDITVQ